MNSTQNDIRVSAILVNWNRSEDVVDTVASLQAESAVPMEIIVVDNGSEDLHLNVIKNIPNIRLIEVGENKGPSIARNLGAAEAVGEYLLFIDSDATLAPGSLAALVDRMEQNQAAVAEQKEPPIGLIACRILNAFTNDIDQWIYPQSYATHGDTAFDTYSFSAAGAMMPRDVFETLGGFWGEMFMYNEETELSLRIIRAGYRIVYGPDAKVLHRESPEGRMPSGRYWMMQSRNWMWLFHRHYPSPAKWFHIAKYSLVYLIKGSAAGKPTWAIKGIWQGLTAFNIARQFPDKMNTAELKHYADLNPRRGIKLGR